MAPRNVAITLTRREAHVLRHLLAVVLVGADELPLWQADMRYLMSIARKLAAQNVTAIMPAEPPESVGT